KPRPGMLEAGAHPDDVLFKGEVNDGQFSGIAYIFNAQCGQVPFHVKGPVLDNGGRIVLTGLADFVAEIGGRDDEGGWGLGTSCFFVLLGSGALGNLTDWLDCGYALGAQDPHRPSVAVGRSALRACEDFARSLPA